MDVLSENRNATLEGQCGAPAPSYAGSFLFTSVSSRMLGTLALVYLVTCSALRFRAEKQLRRRFARYTDRASMATMSNDDAQAILRNIITYEFPFLYKIALQFAIVKTYGIETISRLLAATKSFSDPVTAPKR